MKKSVLFDMDGVILDSMSFHVRAWQDALAECGVSVPEEVIYLHEGAIEPKTAIDIFEKNGLRMDEEGFKGLFRRQMEIFNTHYRHMVRPYPEAPGLVKTLSSKGIRIALVTSSHKEIVENILPKEILGRIDHIVTGDSINRRKPFPDPYLAAVSGLGIHKQACLVVENAPAGIAAAKAASLHCVAITTTLSMEYLSQADKVLSSHVELEEYISEWTATN
ncbi:MAG: HAD family hydrolase [Dissulfurimicrobium sp.]|uniref:HAD family hydrolase n=1 Tax=Dissulfurimicrobium TaxID=1769732 RepID=UPI001EDB39E6|nr:HAD family phosphatase [Dissulfurimicrobium hydrothermale]UKL13126.1 HAD family phosphatase [Dissulfurimicrobium hydrothermale]